LSTGCRGEAGEQDAPENFEKRILRRSWRTGCRELFENMMLRRRLRRGC